MKIQSINQSINQSKKRSFLAFAIASIIFPTASFAETGFNSCNALLTAGIYNTSQSSNAVDSESMQKSSFCAFDYSKVASGSSQAAGVEASYKLFSFGTNNSATSQQIQEKQSSVCTDGFGSEKYSSRASNFARNVYQGSLDAWNRCQALAQQGVNFDLQIDQSMQGATVTLSTTSSGSTVNFNGLDQIGLGRSICTTTRNSNTGSSTGKVLTVDKTTSLKFNSASKLTITCERQMSSDGKGGLFADAQTLVFNTSAGSYQVPMVTIGLSPRVTVDQAVANLEASMNSQFQQLKSSVDSQINSLTQNLAKNGKVLAMIHVKDGNVLTSSSGVSFDKATGVVTFPNPSKLSFVPVISDISNSADSTYMTDTNFLRHDFDAGVDKNKFRVWTTPLDTGARNAAPKSFTAVVVSF